MRVFVKKRPKNAGELSCTFSFPFPPSLSFSLPPIPPSATGTQGEISFGELRGGLSPEASHAGSLISNLRLQSCEQEMSVVQAT